MTASASFATNPGAVATSRATANTNKAAYSPRRLRMILQPRRRASQTPIGAEMLSGRVTVLPSTLHAVSG